MMTQQPDELLVARSEIERLRTTLKSAEYCLYFLLLQTHDGRMRINAEDILRIPSGHCVVRREVFETGDIEFKLYDATQDKGLRS